MEPGHPLQGPVERGKRPVEIAGFEQQHGIARLRIPAERIGLVVVGARRCEVADHGKDIATDAETFAERPGFLRGEFGQRLVYAGEGFRNIRCAATTSAR